MNNHEKLKRLDAKEFANILDGDKLACDYCLYNTDEFSHKCTIAHCKDGIVEWLESEAEV